MTSPFAGDLAGEAAVDQIEAQQVRIGLGRRQIVDGDDGQVLAVALDNCAQYVAADAAKSVDGDAYGHHRLLLTPLTPVMPAPCAGHPPQRFRT